MGVDGFKREPEITRFLYARSKPDATQNSNTPIIRNRTGGVIKPILFKQIVNTGLGGGFALRVPIRPHFGVSSIWKLLLFE